MTCENIAYKMVFPEREIKYMIERGTTMKRTTRLTSILLSILLVATLLLSAIPAMGEETITLRMVESLTSPARTDLLRGQLDQFEAANPGIKVELISPPLSDADNKIAQMLMNQQPLDVLEVRDQTAAQFVNNKWVFAMDEYVDAWDEYDGLKDTAKMDINAIGGADYLIPYGFYQRCLYYNVNKFEEAGIAVPTTFGEMYEAAKALTDPSTNSYGYSFRGAAGGHWYAEMHIQAKLGDKVSDECSFYTTQGDTIFSQPEAVEAMNEYIALYNDGAAPDALNWSYAEMVEAFVSGVTAMLIQDPEVIATCEDRMEPGTWATTMLPVGDETGISFGPMGYSGWGITAYSEHKDEAWKLITFLCGVEANTEFCKANSLLPIHKSAAEDPYFSSEAYQCYLTMGNDVETWACAVAPLGYAGWGEFNNFADSDLQKMLSGSMTPEDLLAKWDAFWLEQKTV